MPPPPEERRKTHSHEEVLTIIANLYAKPSDYLIQTYFKIYQITEGPLYDKHKTRFENIIFNNFSQIAKTLTTTVFHRKTREILERDLNRVKYISCICSNPTGFSPVFVQFFDPKNGIEHRILDYTESASAISAILSRHNVIRRVVGYCGDYCFRDSANVNHCSDHFSSLRILSGNRVVNLPNCDGFLRMLFNVLVDYLPKNVERSLIKLGETVVGIKHNSESVTDLICKYTKWIESDQHILASDCARFVADNFNTVRAYLESFQNLPESISSLFSTIQERFFLLFTLEMYRKLSKTKLSDNSAVVYYFQLLKIRDFFQVCEENNSIPTKIWTYFNAELETLCANQTRQLFKEISIEISDFYSRALNCLEPLLAQFDNFPNFEWVLLTGPMPPGQVHETYHILTGNTCEKCEQLLREAKLVNDAIAKLPVLEVDNVAGKWVMVFEKCEEVPMVVDLVTHLLSLPASCDVGGLQSDCEYTRAEEMVRINWKGVRGEEVVEHVEEFFQGFMDPAEEVVSKNQISPLVD